MFQNSSGYKNKVLLAYEEEKISADVKEWRWSAMKLLKLQTIGNNRLISTWNLHLLPRLLLWSNNKLSELICEEGLHWDSFPCNHDYQTVWLCARPTIGNRHFLSSNCASHFDWTRDMNFISSIRIYWGGGLFQAVISSPSSQWSFPDHFIIHTRALLLHVIWTYFTVPFTRSGPYNCPSGQ